MIGFLSTEDDVITGNFGLKDETAVLIWIQKHITSFGGDPTNVSLSGGSSGAIDVSLHLYSPLSKGLFHRAISQSGQALNSEVIHFPGTAKQTAWDLGRIAGCTTPDTKTSEQLLSCLRQIPAKDLTRYSLKLQHDYILPFITFGSVIEPKYSDGAFIVNDPCQDIKVSSSIPWILGGIPDEGSQRSLSEFLTYIVDALFSKKKFLDHFEIHKDRLLPEYFRFSYYPRAAEVFDKIKKRYMDGKSIKDSFYEIARIYGFSNFHLGTIETALRYKGPLYLYCYDYSNNYAYLKTYLMMLSKSTKFKIGALHGEELISLFNNELLYPPVLDGDDRIVSDQVVDLWYNFVKYGNPNGPNAEVWKPVSSSKLEYLHINNLTLTMRDNYFLGEEYEFWKSIGSPTLCAEIGSNNKK